MKKTRTSFLRHVMRSAAGLMLPALLALTTVSTQAQTITIGTGTSSTLSTGSGPSSLQSPYNSYYGYSYVQTIYLQSEITAVGNITSINYYYAGSSLSASDSLTIYMGHVSRSAFASNTDWEPVGNLTQVFNGNISGTLPGWVTINLTTPFPYNNIGNLLIAVDENRPNDNGTTGFRASNLGSGRVIFYRSDTNNPSPSSPPTASGTSSYVGNIQINGLTLTGCQPISGLAVTTTAPNGATVSWSAPAGGDPVSQYNWELRSSGAAGSGATGLVQSGNSATTSQSITSLTAATSYTLYVRTDCGAMQSPWSAGLTIVTSPANDEPSGAIALTVNSDLACTSTLNGTTISANASSATAPTCSPTGINDDVWFSFVAGSQAHRISFSNVNTGTMVAALYTGTPGNLTPVGGACASSTLDATGLTPGTTYYVRAYTSSATVTTTTTFTICAGTNPPPPANDNCSGAIAFPAIPPDGTCASVTANTLGATQSMPACAGTADDDVWYSFVCPAGVTALSYANTTVSGSSDRAIQFFSGTCGALTSLYCYDDESGNISGLTPGQTYYFRIHTYSSSNNTEVSVCLKALPSMTYVSSTTASGASSAAAGANNQQIIGIRVVTNGLSNPLVLNQFTFTTNGTTNAADITTAKVYYTGTSSTFATTTAFGSPVPNPNGTYSISGSQALAGGTSNTTNYFWLAYDVSCSAASPSVLDAECTSVNVGTAQTPTAVSPSGTTSITTATYTATTNQSSTSTVLSGSTDQQILRVALTGCSSSTVTSLTFGTAGSTNAADIAAARVYFTPTTTFSTATLFGSPVPNPSGSFTVNGSQLLGALNGYFWLVYDLAAGATAGNVIDASCASATISGNTATPSTTNPTGTRTIAAAAVNDMPAGALVLNVNGTCSSTYSNSSSGLNNNEPRISCKGSQTDASQVWFKFVAPASGFVKVSTDYPSTALDTKIGLFSATNPADLGTYTIIACDDDGGVNGSSSALYASGLVGGNTYYVAVAHYNGTSTDAFCIDVKEVTSAMLAPAGSCVSSQALAGMLPAYTGWYSMIDASGNLIAEVKQTAGTATGFTGSYTALTGPSRTDVAGQAYLNRNFLVSGDNATGAVLKLYFSDAERTSLGSALNTLNVSRVAGSTCNANFNGTATVLTQASSNSVNGISWIEVATPGFSNFYIMSGTTPLPVTLKSFTGKNAGAVNNLNWETAEEKNFSHFELQRSSDGIAFSSIAQLSSDRSSNGSKYAYTDAAPFKGVNIYRLKMVDLDGKASLSNIVTLDVKETKYIGVQVYPNPVQQTLNIRIAGQPDGQASIQIMDLTGKVIRTQNLQGNSAQMDMSHIPSGMYLMKYTDNSHSSVTKITRE